MKALYKITVVLAALAISLSAMAQNTVRGTVKDADGITVPGAGVVLQGTTSGTITNENGEFEIKAKPGDKLEVSFLGYVTSIVEINQAANYMVVLNEDKNLLEEVVVVGYDTQKKVNLTGSVASISSEILENKPIVSASSALQGVAAGVTVTTQSGAPGDDGGMIRVRGIGTFGGSSAAPLVLIDGVEGSLDAVDATQIDKISVLKDAASSAIYGSRAANGVILVTTKRAEKGVRSVTYRGYAGWQEPTSQVSLVGPIDYMKLVNEENINDGKGQIYSDDYINNYMANHAVDPDTYPITDWQKAVLNGSGFTTNHNLNLTASGEKIRVNTSIGYLYQGGVIKSDDYQRFNIRNNMDVQVAKHLHMKFDFSVIYGHRNRAYRESTMFNYMNTRDPLSITQWSTGNYAALSGGSTNILACRNGEDGNKQNDSYRINGALTLSYDPFKWLTIEGMAAPRYVMSEAHSYEKIVNFYNDPFGDNYTSSAAYGSLTESCTRNFYGNYLLTLNFHHTWAKVHNFKAILGASYEDFNQKTLSAYRQGYPFPDYETINAGNDNEYKKNSGARYQWALASFFGRVNYNYKERYLVEGNLRVDGSSRFNAKNRWGVFPSVSAAWRLTEEPFMQSIKNIFTEGKLRASYGQLGNQNVGDSYYPTVSELNISSAISVNDVLTPIATQTSLANEDITWETTEMYDVGVDLSFWNKLTLTADWYYKTTRGILMKLDIPSSIGLAAPYQNAGVVRNVGWELAIGYHDTYGNFKWGVDFNLSDVNNKIIDMKGTTGGSGVVRNQEGYEINSIWGLTCEGIIRSEEQAEEINTNCPQYGQTVKVGDLYYKDIAGAVDENGNSIPDGKVDDNDKSVIGGTIPRFSYGITLNFGWKGINLSAFFQGVGQADCMLSSYYIWPHYQGGTYRSECLNRLNPSDKSTWATATYPRLTGNSVISWKESTFWMADASYCRLKNLQLSYTFPKKWMDHCKLKGIMVFANAQNLFTWTKFYQGYDPELAYSGSDDGVTLGAVAYNYPQVRTFTFGLEIKF